MKDTKFRELILYVADRCEEDPRFGAVKLNKILYYSDFTAYRLLGHSVTGADYQHLSEGPAPRQLLTVREKLIQGGCAKIETRPYFDQSQERLVAKRLPKLDIFAKEELEIVDSVIEGLWSLNARQVSEISHQEIGWKLTEEGESIPYSSAWISSQPLTMEQIEAGRDIAKRHGVRR